MPYYYSYSYSDDEKEKYFVEMPGDYAPPTTSTVADADPGEISCLVNYESLPCHLKSILDYIFISKYCEKDKLVRLLLAEGLVPEKQGEIMEDVAKNVIEELISLGMLEENHCFGSLEVVEPYNKLCLIEVEEHEFISKAENLPVHAILRFEGRNHALDFKNLRIRSLFVNAECASGSYRGFSMKAICKLQFLQVLYIFGKIESFPDEVGNLVHLTYLGLVNSNLDKLPGTLGNLQKLQTLSLKCCGRLRELPIEVLKIQQLRHLLISSSIDNCEIRVQKEIGTLMNLQTCEGVYAGDGIANALGTLTQLRKLGIKRVSEDHASELASAIMKMENLRSLSLEAEQIYIEGTCFQLLPEFEPFSPPYHLEELLLDGGLVEMPNWLFSMENLTKLSLYRSNLAENLTSVLQYLPKLKDLTLWNVCSAKIISKEFCEPGGFASLEILLIASGFLVEWTEIVSGAFPRLRYLRFSNCLNLRFLPEGLQNISTLQELDLCSAHGELARRLQGEENYKIKHISRVFLRYSHSAF